MVAVSDEVLHDETLENIADLAQDSRQSSPERHGNSSAQQSSEENPDIGSSDLQQSSLLSIEMTDANAATRSESNTQGALRDPGVYKLVHFKAPEPQPKRKRLRLDPARTETLEPSQFVTMDTVNLTRSLSEPRQTIMNGLIEMPDGQLRPAEIHIGTESAENADRSALPVDSAVLHDGRSALPDNSALPEGQMAQLQSDHLMQTTQDTLSAVPITNPDRASHSNTNQTAAENKESHSDQSKPHASNTQETRELPRNSNKRPRSQISGGDLGDTDVIGFDLHPCIIRPRSPVKDSKTDPEQEKSQQVVLSSKSTLQYDTEREKTCIECEMQVLGLQPLPKQGVDDPESRKYSFHSLLTILFQ